MSENSRYPKESALIGHYDTHLDYESSADRFVLELLLRTFSVSIPPETHVLDLGCGDGRLGLALADLGAQVEGVDYSLPRIQRARERATAEELGCTFHHKDLHSFLDEATSSYDVILAFEVLEHLEEPEVVLARARALLAPGGVLLGSVPLNHPYEAHLQVFADLDEVRRRLAPHRFLVRHGHVFASWGREQAPGQPLEPTRPTISLCMIVRDEADNLPACLASVQGCVDEIVVVDTGSEDGTPQLARALGARVLHRPWDDDFSAPRNTAVQAATGDWVLVLDADERLAPGAGPLLREAAKRWDADAFLLPLHQASDPHATPQAILSGQARLREPVLLHRLLRRTPDLHWRGIIHEGVGAWLVPRLHRVRGLEAAIVHLGAAREVRQRLGKDQRNVRLLRRRCDLDPDDHSARAYLAGHLASVGDLDGAAEVVEQGWAALERVMAADSPRPAFVQIASQRLRLQLLRDDLAGMHQTFDAVDRWAGQHPHLALAAEHPNLHFFRGSLQERLADRLDFGAPRTQALAAAAGAFARALALADRVFPEVLEPGCTSWAAAARLGTVLLQLGDLRQSQGAFDHALTCLQGTPDTPVTATSREAAELGQIEVQIASGQAAAARQALAAHLESAQPDAWALLGCAHTAEGRFEQAADCAARAQARSEGGWHAPHRARWLGWLEAAPGDGFEVVFIGGVGRSGTTLLRAMLDAHPRLHCGPEAKLVPLVAGLRERWGRALGRDLEGAGISPELLDAGLRAMLETVLAGRTPAGLRPAEKTPHNVLHIATLARLFPRARFVHVVRDGRAVVASLLEQDWADPESGRRLAVCQEAEAAARYWVEALLRGRREASAAVGRVLEVRYEELVTAPEAQLQRVLAFLGEEWDDAVLRHEAAGVALPDYEAGSEAAGRPVFTSSLERWRQALSGAQLEQVEAIAGEVLAVL